MKYLPGWLSFTLYFNAVHALLDPRSAASVTEIANTINLFGAMVDSGSLQLMPDVFTSNCSVDFDLPGVGTLRGIPAVSKEIESISNVTSQHSITTVHSDLQGAGRSNSTASIVGSFFGTGPQQGQVFTVYGTYYLGMLLTGPGWRIDTMTLKQTGSVGNISIAFPNGVP